MKKILFKKKKKKKKKDFLMKKTCISRLTKKPVFLKSSL